MIDYVREVRPRRAYDIHDALLTDLARPVYDHQIGALGGADHQRLSPGRRPNCDRDRVVVAAR